MPRLTKADIERELLSGKSISWKEASNKTASIVLGTAKQRRLLAFLLKSRVREVKALPSDFIEGLSSAYDAANDPASNSVGDGTQSVRGGPWKIHSLKVAGFGGVNAPKGKPLELVLDRESMLIEGPNGSGKSSLTAALVWAMTGERPRDQDDQPCDARRPVFGGDDKHAGDWPPLATYPTEIVDLKLHPPLVSVEVILSDPAGKLASILRKFDGKDTTINFDPNLNIPSVLLEAGLLMPTRLPQIRLDKGHGRLTEAVQKLTGLDDLVDLGIFIQGLCHKSRDFLSFKTSELATAKAEFDRQIDKARAALLPVSVTVPGFKPSDTENAAAEMGTLGKFLNEKASQLTSVLSNDLAVGLDLADAAVQKQIGLSLAGAEQDVKDGLEGLPTWKTLSVVRIALDKEARAKLGEVMSAAHQNLEASLGFYRQEQTDNRFRLKAAGARWHAEHGDENVIETCPLCTHSLAADPELRQELEGLKSAGEASTRRLADNLNAILVDLEKALPIGLKRYLSDSLTLTPKESLLSELRGKFVTADRYVKYLAKFGGLVAAACGEFPPEELALPIAVEPSAPQSAAVVQRMVKIEIVCMLADWFEDNQAACVKWWQNLVTGEPLADGSVPMKEPEPLWAHLERLGKSIGEAEPYRIGAEAMRGAWKEGKIAHKIESELARRNEIAFHLSPLKNLSSLAEAQARSAINDLSERIGEIHSQTYLSDTLQFQKASFEKKAGLVVRGKFSDSVRIDATLVANTSWLRGVLWAFIFALREEAVQQLGADFFPVLVLDDPQQTFDSEHRHRWAEQIAKLQKTPPGVQLILATHEELFLSFLEIDGVAGRQTLICSAGPELGHIGLFEGDALNRRWAEVQKQKTPAIARDYMAAVRVYVEGMLRLMLRAEDVDVSTSVIGDCREKLSSLHKAALEPWNRSAFAKLAGLLGRGVPEIKYIEISHHTSGASLGMTEAVDVEKYWKKSLRPAIERSFRIARDHRALHGGLTALHAMPPTAALPEGYKAIVGSQKLPLIGTAAALSDGKAADGCVNLTLDGVSNEIVELKDHVVFRITSPTLEPVARPGDLVLVSDHTPPSAKSLVVAMSEDRLLARRLEIADNHSDVAVLTASAINPRMIAPPVVAKLSTLSLRKVVGVIFDHAKSVASQHGNMEICNCGGEANVKTAFSGMQGLVEVVGHSAEPHAIDGQFLIIGKPVSSPSLHARLEGRPIIAEDSDGTRYFKRYRQGGSVVILESLEIGGDFAPIVLAGKPGSMPYVQAIWPVLGVLFERPK